MTSVLLTGAGGFAAHHCLEHFLRETDWDIVATDSFRHKGTTDRISQVLDGQFAGVNWNTLEGATISFEPMWWDRTTVMTHDLTAPFSPRQVKQLEGIDYMVCYASESHVDRSITDPVPFVRNNVDVALNSLELARAIKPKQVIWVSTDEVYGPVEATDMRGHKEWAPILPSNPYSASKAAQEAIAISYWRTYGVPVVLVNAMNMIGERQDPEKFVPLVLAKVLAGEGVTIHGSEGNVGTRHYLHARNLADAILFLVNYDKPVVFPAHASRDFEKIAEWPDRYNIATPDRIDNLTLATMIADIAGRPLKYRYEDFHATRPGHDPHYGLDSTKITRLGWSAPVPFDESLRRTVEWSIANPDWL